MPLVTMPNGDKVRFPDEMPRDQISSFIEEKFPGTFTGQQQPEPTQEPQPRNYALSEVPGAALSNFGRNAGEIGGAIADRYREVGATGLAKDVGKTVVGMAQEFIPGQQQYETEYADPLYQKLLQDWGWNEPNARAQYEQIKRHIAEQPVQAALDTSMVTAPGIALPGRAGRTLATTSRVVNPVSAAGRGVTTVAKRAVTPFPAGEGLTESAQYLRGLGVRPTAGQATGSRRLKFAESELGGARTGDIIDQQQNAYARAALGHIGEDAPRATPQVMDRAYRRIGNDFNQIAARNTLVPDQALYADVGNVVNDYVQNVPIAAPGVQGMAQAIAQRAARGPISGTVYQRFRSRLARLGRRTTDPELGAAWQGLREALDDAMERSMTAAGRADDVAAWRAARDQYRHFVALERAAIRHPGAAEGTITPGALTTAASSGSRRRGFVTGQGDYSQLAHAGQAVLTPMPESGTAARLAAQAVPAAIGATLGFGSGGGLGAVAGGIAGKMAAGRTLMSRPVQGYLANQLVPSRGTTPLGRAAGTVGRVLTGAVPRVAAIDHTKSVLSPEAFNNLGRDPETRGELAKWIQAKTSGNGLESAAIQLADSIATKVNRPDLAERIARELLGN